MLDSTLPSTQTNSAHRQGSSADRAYITVTIAAILLVLGSLWVF